MSRCEYLKHLDEFTKPVQHNAKNTKGKVFKYIETVFIVV